MSCAVFTGFGIFLYLYPQANKWFLSVCFTFAVMSLLTGSYLAWKEQYDQLSRLTQLPKLLIDVRDVFVLPGRRSDVSCLFQYTTILQSRQ